MAVGKGSGVWFLPNERSEQGNLVLQQGQSAGELQVMLETVGSRSSGLGAGIAAESSLHCSLGSLL